MAFEDSMASQEYETTVFVCGSQMGKTDCVLDAIGWRLDVRPRPQLYVGPDKNFVEDQFSPRIKQMVSDTPSLLKKASKKREKRTLKLIGGVPLRLAWAGSASQLSSDSFGDVYVDELDRMSLNVKGEGDPLAMAKARSFTYKDRKIAVTSTPKVGNIDVEVDEASGLEFWAKADPADLQSPIWKLWQSGTMHHWSWPCPHCEEYFIPRFSCLSWPKKDDGKRISPADAVELAYVRCPRCHGEIREHHKADMNARGVYVAPGQKVDLDGSVYGEPRRSRTYSLWVSGLASPFVTFGERAAAYIEALESGSLEELQAVVNTGFGELFSNAGGDLPSWAAVQALSLPYAEGTIPDGVKFLTCGVDVQNDHLVYTVRGWGDRQESWNIQAGKIWGDTSTDDPWLDLGEMIMEPIGSLRIKRTFVDSGFRPGKRDKVPEHKVYEFCRRYSGRAFATKGWETRTSPLSVNRIDVDPGGQKAKYGLDLVRLDSDFFKSWVHQRLRWPADQPGGWHLHDSPTEDYCKQIVSEARVRKPSGSIVWITLSKNNHFLDAEALAYAAAFMLGVSRMNRAPVPGKKQDAPGNDRETESQHVQEQASQPAAPRKRRSLGSLAALNRTGVRQG